MRFAFQSWVKLISKKGSSRPRVTGCDRRCLTNLRARRRTKGGTKGGTNLLGGRGFRQIGLGRIQVDNLQQPIQSGLLSVLTYRVDVSGYVRGSLESATVIQWANGAPRVRKKKKTHISPRQKTRVPAI